jgi:hypothetical protein
MRFSVEQSPSPMTRKKAPPTRHPAQNSDPGFPQTPPPPTRAKCDFPTCRAPRNTNGLRPARVRQFNNSSSALRLIYAILTGDFNIKSEIFVGNNL